MATIASLCESSSAQDAETFSRFMVACSGSLEGRAV